jgi:hypothetical protein
MPQASPLTDQAIRDTLEAIVRHQEYDRSFRQTAIERFFAWLGELFGPLGRALSGSVALQRLALGLVILLAVAIVARAAMLAHAARVARAADRDGGRRRGQGSRLADPWLEAQRLAALGDHTAAAHAAYAAVLGALARRARIRTHPSKTVGDYARELRRVQSPLAARYREFARLYEVVIYGVGTCDADRWARLQSLAADLVERDRAAA